MGKMTKSKELIIAVFIFVSVVITTVILAVCAVSERENEKNMQRQLSAENKIQSVIETKSIEYLQETGEEDAEIMTDSFMLTENTKDTIKEAAKEISCWGDSMMEGCGKGFAVINNNGLYKDISNYDSPFTVEELTRYNTYNFGVAGETSYEIAIRAGGIGIYIDRNLHLTSYTTERARLIDDYGNVVNMNDFSGYGWENNDYPNTVYINNVLCLVENIENSDEVYISICIEPEIYNIEDVSMEVYNSEDDDMLYEMDADSGTRVVPKAAYDHKSDILILEMGSNGGWCNDYEELITQYQSIIDFFGCDNYIIVVDTDDPGFSADAFQGMTDEIGGYIGTQDTYWEAALREAFGEHFLNTRVYIVENGLYDCGLLATRQDIIDESKGYISKQLRADNTHFNSYGYYSKGLAIYQKGLEMGYWD